jgi:hypothetical protein
MRQISLIVVALAMVPLLGCASTPRHDLAHYPFPEAQAELRAVLDGIIHDSTNANVVGLRDSHLNSDKFTKFGGGEIYDRMNYEQCVDVETAAITSVEEYKAEARDVKIDVFGEVAVMTYYPYRVIKKDGKVLRYSTRQTLVFLRTAEGWKIVHEHQSPKKYEE